MNVSLTPQLEGMIRERVDSGQYNNASEVVREALRLLDDRDREIQWLREQIAIGEQQLRDGRSVEVNDQLWDDIDRRVEERLRANATHADA